jgi:hypothetical protein
MWIREPAAPLGAVKNSKIADFFGCNSLKTNDRNFAKTYFLTAPYGAAGSRNAINSVAAAGRAAESVAFLALNRHAA